jgi:hypothetical protein
VTGESVPLDAVIVKVPADKILRVEKVICPDVVDPLAVPERVPVDGLVDNAILIE